MKNNQETIEKKMYQSEELPNLQTTDPRIGAVIKWADKHPQVWHLLVSRRSKAFGANSSVYIGWAQRNESPEALLERARRFHSLVTRAERNSAHNVPILAWAAKFTFEHFYDEDFASGFFQQHDAMYPRSCLALDYTEETREAVLDKFCQWMDRQFQTVEVTLDGNIVRTFPTGKAPSVKHASGAKVILPDVH